MNTLINAVSLFDKSRLLALYLTIGIVGIFILVAIGIRVYDKSKLPLLGKYFAGFIFGYATAVSAFMLLIYFTEMKEEGSFVPAIFWPIFSALIAFAVLAAAGLILSILKPKIMKVYSYVALGVSGALALALLIVYLVKQYKQSFVLKDDLVLLFGVVALIGIAVIITLVFGKKSLNRSETKSIAYAAVCIALSFALSYMRLFKLPQGGSVTLASLLPLMFYSYLFGTRKGVLACVIYGLLQAIQDPWIIHPIQFLLDYPVAFLMVGLTGMFRDKGIFKEKTILQFIFGALAAVTLRYFCHVITGIIVFGSYAAEGFNEVAWGFVYNLFVFADAAIAMALGAIMLANKSFKKFMLSVNS